MLCCCTLVARAQATPVAAGSAPAAQHAPAPIKTGTATSGADAGESNDELEQYTHSSVVQSMARHLHITTNQASRYFEDFNSGVLIAVILYYLIKLVPAKFRAKREGIASDLENARRETADAQARLTAIEARLSSMGSEVDALREQAAASGKAEEARIHASLEEERARIVRSAEEEIAAAQSNAERGLRRFASELALERAAARVQSTPESERAQLDRQLTEELLEGLAGKRGLAGTSFGGKN